MMTILMMMYDMFCTVSVRPLSFSLPKKPVQTFCSWQMHCSGYVCCFCAVIPFFVMLVVISNCQSVSILQHTKDKSRNAFSQPVKILKRQPVS